MHVAMLWFSAMRYLVLSDVHANLLAFEAVVGAAERRDYDAVIFLGDIAGYGNRIEGCVQLLRSLRPVVTVLGNHDALLLEAAEARAESHRMDSMVERVISRHRAEISPESLAYIRSFSDSFVGQEWQAVHGGLRRPWEYIDSIFQAQANAPYLARPLCLFGHTHVPMVYAALATPDGELWRTVPLRGEECRYRLPPQVRAFFNPGSVGQPRDGVPLASFGIFDADRRVFELYRVAYDVERVKVEMRAEGYPEILAERLASGH